MADTKKVILWIVGGCGVLVLLAGGTCLGIGYYAKSKVESKIAETNPALAEQFRKGGVTGALKGGAGQMVAAGVAMYGGTVMVMVLPPGEQKAHSEILEKLVKIGPSLSEKEIQELSKALERSQDAHKGDKSLPTAAEARAFFAEVKAVVDRH
jgi:hypothetical protein